MLNDTPGRRPRRWPNARTAALVLALLALAGLLDYALTARGVALPVYYLAPILAMAWLGGWPAALITTALAAGVNLAIDLAFAARFANLGLVHGVSLVFFLLMLALARVTATLRLMRDFATRGEAWRASIGPRRAGERLVLVPAWQRDTFARSPEARPDDLVVLLEHGQAFGTGSHPTTQMCLALLEAHVQPGQRVFDLGCGTGILSLAAARLGAGWVLGVDVQAEAVPVAQANAVLNGVADRVEFRGGSLAHGQREAAERGPFDLAVANILADIVIGALEAGLAQIVRPGGVLILSGIREAKIGAVRQAVAAAGLTIEAERQTLEWLALVARPTPPAGDVSQAG